MKNYPFVFLAIVICIVLLGTCFFFIMKSDEFANKQNISVEENLRAEVPIKSNLSESSATSTHAKLTARIDRMTERTINLTLVEFASGNRADQAALETGACVIDQVEKGDCTPNDFFVRVTNKTFSLPLSKDVTILTYARSTTGGGMLPNTEGNIHLIPVTIKQLMNLFKNDPSMQSLPFDIITTNGYISSMEEQYVP